MNRNRVLDNAHEALRRGRAGDALAMLAKLPERDSDECVLLLEGLIYEFGGDGVGLDLTKALGNYRRVAVMLPDAAPPCLYIARVLLKTDAQPEPILKWLEAASRVSHDADTELAYAAFYEEGKEIDLVKARACFRRAACAGRFAGFVGVSRILRKQGKWLRAFAVDGLRLLVGPLLRLLIGRRVTASFNGYGH